MEKIERRPLPPPNSTAAEIAEADRSEMLARANDVIDHYLNGPGSYWDAGTRKPLQETIRDLKDFKDQVTASKQCADDPNSVMDSIINLIEQTTEQVEQAMRNGEVKDRIAIPYPETNDPIDDPRVISPIELSNGALPISRRLTRRDSNLVSPSAEIARPSVRENAWRVSANDGSLVPNLRLGSVDDPNAADRQPVRYLSSRIDRKSVPSGSGAGTTAPPLVPLGEGFDLRQAPIGDRLGSATARYPTDSSRSEIPLAGLVSGKPMSFHPIQPPIWDFPDSSAPNGGADDWLTRLLQGMRSW